jgi:glycerophosphoryl diester phosphodiesterase
VTAPKGFPVFGHRGARGLAPENSLPGFDLARDLALTGVEFDIALSADDVALVHHDPQLNAEITRDAAGQYLAAPGPILRDRAAVDLACFDIGRAQPGSAYAARYPTQRALDAVRIPTLHQVLDALGPLDLLLELKTFPDRPSLTAPPDVMAAAVIAVLRQHRAIERSILFAFDWRVLRAVAGLEPLLRRCCLTAPDTIAPISTRGGRLWLDDMDLEAFGGEVARAVAATGACAWAPLHSMLDRRSCALAQSLGLTVIPWTVNLPSDIESIIALGVDALISDYPDRVIARLRGEGRDVASPGFVATLRHNR